MSGILYSVATPIGNLDDMTPRAIKTLSSVDYILCEDTRVSSKLLSRFDIHTKLIAYHKFNEKEQLQRVITDIESGKNIALISDAGTPCVSDPGRVLINELHTLNIKIVPISGACAVSTFLSIAPKNNEAYTFTGFIPRTQNEQEKFFEKYGNTDIIFYESPNRLIKTLENIRNYYSENIKVTVGRELTKLYEEIKSGKIIDIIEYFSKSQPKGEIVIMVHCSELYEENSDSMEISTYIKKLKTKGYSTKDISIILSTLFDINKNTVYETCRTI